MTKEKIDKKYNIDWIDYGLTLLFSFIFSGITYAFWYDIIPPNIMWCIATVVFPLYLIGFTCVAMINKIVIELSKKKNK